MTKRSSQVIRWAHSRGIIDAGIQETDLCCFVRNSGLYLIIENLSSALDQKSAASSPDAWQNRWWLEKASRALRGGDPLSSSENPDTLLAQGRDQAVASFLKDPRFGDTVLDFSMMFLGFRQDRIKKEKGTYNEIVYQFPQAIQASKEVLNDGDFLSKVLKRDL